MQVKEYFREWYKVIDHDELSKVIRQLDNSICPEPKNIFRAFELCPYDKCCVVILGMDPYPDKYMGKPRATGIMFGNSTDVREEDLSPSLQVIKECVIDFGVPHNRITFDNTLESWARQGVLLLNSALTCSVGKTGSHTMLWRKFTASLLRNLSVREKGIVYLLLGEQAQTFTPYINREFNYILKERHPAYYARTNKPMPPVFKEVDRILKNNYNININWFNEEL